MKRWFSRRVAGLVLAIALWYFKERELYVQNVSGKLLAKGKVIGGEVVFDEEGHAIDVVLTMEARGEHALKDYLQFTFMLLTRSSVYGWVVRIAD